MDGKQILLSFVGNRDPYREESEEHGPVLSLLGARSFAEVYLFYNGPQYLERAKTVEKIAGESGIEATFRFVCLELRSPVDYEEIYAALSNALSMIMERTAHEDPSFSILLDPGTPQMQTAWFLLAGSGAVEARLLQGVPPHISGGRYMVREVRLGGGVLPEMIAAGSAPEMVMESARAAGPAPVDYELSAGLTAAGRRIVGTAPPFTEVLHVALRVAGYDVSVLILGDTGTGKGMVARLIHENSDRRDCPFVPINCAAITASLAESELFGHVKGAFTGASADRIGRFRAAEGGTVFLDEIGDLPPEIQPKLLRLLEEKVLTPVGSEKPRKVDVRIIAATNRDLAAAMESGEFRQDLYQRLNQVTLRMPRLADRRTDIPLLLAEFLDRWNSSYGENKALSDDAVKYLLDYPWPGNVRELENAVVSMCACSLSDSIGPDLLPADVLSHFDKERTIGHVDISIPEDGLDLKAYLFNIEKAFYEEALKRTGDNGERAARLLGLNGPAFRKALRERFGR